MPTRAPSLPPLAQRVERIAPFHVMELVKRARELERAGRSIVHLSIGEPDFTAPPAVVAALERAVRAGATAYTAALGTPELRAAIARYHFEAFGIDLDPARVVVTAGASAALLLACCALVDPGDRVLMADPSYPCNRHFVSAFDGVPTPIDVGPATRFQLDAALVQSHWTTDERGGNGVRGRRGGRGGCGVRGVMLATPSNPTGTSIPFDELGRIIDVAREHGGYCIVDEIYLGLSYDGPARSALAHGDDIVVAGSFSKFFHMTGWRLGWLIVPPAWVATFEKLAQNLFICASTLAQHAALGCFEAESMAIYAARRDELRARRDYIVPAMCALGYGVPAEPDGAFYVYLDCSRFSADSHAHAARLLEERGVALVPGMDFGHHEPQRYLRLSYATSLAQLHEAVARLRP